MQHVTTELEARLRAGEVHDAELVAVLRHFHVCPRCRRFERLDERAMESVRNIIAESDDEEHVDTETLVSLAAGRLSAPDREVAESHLDDCERCRGDLDDLRQFSHRPRRRRRFAAVAFPLAAAAAILVIFATLSRDRSSSPPLRSPIAKPVAVGTATRPLPPPPAAAPGQVSRRYAEPQWTRLVDEVRRTGRLPSPHLDLGGVADVRRGSPAAPVTGPISPAGEVLEETRPEFSWPVRPGSTYVVAVFSDDVEIARSGKLTSGHWKPQRGLPRGRVYVWQVEANHDGVTTILPSPPAPQPMFAVLAEPDARELARARREHPADYLLHAVLYAQHGLTGQARALLRKAGENGDPDAVRLLGKK